MTKSTLGRTARFAPIACGVLLFASACQTGEVTDAADVPDSVDTTEVGEISETTDDADTATTAADDSADPTTTVAAVEGTASCEEAAVLFVTRGSVNENLADPEVAATCDGDTLVVTSNAIPDYTYIGTSPGDPRAQDYTFTIPATPTFADTPTAVPALGTAAVTLSGIPIFGPTEGTGGDVDSLPGIISECGSHNGPTGFHIHKIMTSANTDCLFTPEEVAAAPQLVGYAFDGFPIYTGTGQYTSSWELTDETLFATDTWAAHTYIEGSGDLDECNGLTDADGNYAYYTTDTFPYVVGCYSGVVDLDAAGGGGRGGGGDDDGGERPERPEGEDGGERPEPPEGEDGDERPERPEGEDGGERPEPPEGEEGAVRPEPAEGEQP